VLLEKRGDAMKALGLRHLSLKTRDLKGTERFYTSLLGMEVAYRFRGMVFLRTPGGEDLLDFWQTSRRFDPAAGGLDHFGVHVDRKRFLTLKGRLRAAGIKLAGRRGSWGIYFKDPNGYTVEVYAD
jgi:catechol-2,3-dioxygenase